MRSMSYHKKVGVCDFVVYFSSIGALFELVLLYWMLMFDPCYVGPLSPRHGVSLGCGWRRCLPDMEGSCEYIE
jgi:hypothetical protein